MHRHSDRQQDLSYYLDPHQLPADNDYVHNHYPSDSQHLYVHDHTMHTGTSHDYHHRRYQPRDNTTEVGSHQHHHYYEQPHVHHPTDDSEHCLGHAHAQIRHEEGHSHQCEGHHHDNQDRHDNDPLNRPTGIFDK